MEARENGQCSMIPRANNIPKNVQEEADTRSIGGVEEKVTNKLGSAARAQLMPIGPQSTCAKMFLSRVSCSAASPNQIVPVENTLLRSQLASLGVYQIQDR